MGKVRTQGFGISSVKTMFSVGGCTTVNDTTGCDLTYLGSSFWHEVL
jgi:hypothetical protein